MKADDLKAAALAVAEKNDQAVDHGVKAALVATASRHGGAFVTSVSIKWTSSTIRMSGGSESI